MPRQLALSVLIELPEHIFDAGEIMAAIKVPWYAMLQGLKDKSVKFEHREEISETRTRTTPTGARRGRKPRVTVVEEPKEAA